MWRELGRNHAAMMLPPIGFSSRDLVASFGMLSAGDLDSETSFASSLNKPDVNATVDDVFVGLGALESAVRFGERSEDLRQAPVCLVIEHAYHVGYGAHDWASAPSHA